MNAPLNQRTALAHQFLLAMLSNAGFSFMQRHFEFILVNSAFAMADEFIKHSATEPKV